MQKNPLNKMGKWIAILAGVATIIMLVKDVVFKKAEAPNQSISGGSTGANIGTVENGSVNMKIDR